MSNAVIQKLNELGYSTIPEEFYGKVTEWKSWYQGNVKGFHSYRVRNAHAAHLNAFEAFAPFAAAVLMAQFAGVDHALITRLALAFIACRVLHGVFYLASIPVMRSFVWFGGIGCVLALMAQAALKAGG